MLRIFTSEMGVCVGKNKNSIVARNDSLFAPCASRKPSVMTRMNVACTYELADLEAGSRTHFGRSGFAGANAEIPAAVITGVALDDPGAGCPIQPRLE
jgi:hypothetical protein